MAFGISRRSYLILAFLAGAVALPTLAVGLIGGREWIAPVAIGLGLGAALLLALWLAARVLRVLLWRVGRRLAFSYFLIGVLPIPMVLLLGLLNAYLLAGYFLGHLYRDAVGSLRGELVQAASARLVHGPSGQGAVEPEPGQLAFAYYRGGRRTAGDGRLPAEWPAWLLPEGAAGTAASPAPAAADWVALEGGEPTLAAAAARGDRGVVVLFSGDVRREISRRADVWVALFREEDPETLERLRLQVLGQEFALLPLSAKKRVQERAEFFGPEPEEAGFLDRPFLWWGELTGSLRSLADGSVLSEGITASLNGTVRTVYRHLFSGRSEVDASVWAAVLSVTSLLSTVYALALLMALWIIFTLSRAVDRLSRATEAVRGGDFGVRIPVRRRDQVGELQRNFNEMTANLEKLVAAAAQKELLEKELEIARSLQKSLLPTDLPRTEQVDFATLFEPSAAIGGDYFDVLRMGDDRLAVVIADVAGHGLPSGLRMAMLKAALAILVDEATPAEEMLHRLSAMVRSGAERRLFVTATVSVLDLRRGRLELTNAGHPPTYLVRGGEVEEILLPGSPLGALGDSFGHRELELATGDLVVWLSDGLIEAADPHGEPFGYEGVRRAIAGAAESASELRERLLAAVDAHTGGGAIQDDRTLVAMRYSAADGSPSSPSAS